VGAELRKPGLRQWIEVMEDTTGLLGAVFSVMNPSVFKAGMTCMNAIAANPENINKREHLEELLSMWTSPLTAASLMNNRNSPLHRDTGGGNTYMDMLVSVGDYENGWFNVPGLGGPIWYTPGSVIALCGRIVRHGASAVGERFCYAQYLKETVVRSMGIQQPDWVYIQDLEASCLL
jgi:hypothetical protein